MVSTKTSFTMKYIKFFLPALVIVSAAGALQGMAKAQSTQDIIDQTNAISGSIYRQNETVMDYAIRQEAQRRSNLLNLCWQGYGWACDEYDQTMEAEGARLDRAIQNQRERNEYRSY